jgi:glycosyltransferase involved in cell wall biosynthesis
MDRMWIAIVTPVFNDWASVSLLISELETLDFPKVVRFSLLVIDDGSSEAFSIDYPLHTLRRVYEIEIVSLACNLGHQRAIAVGLVVVCELKEIDAVVVMDSDGEDRPTDIPRLVAATKKNPGHIVCARRGRRPGLRVFWLWYICYRFLFGLLTGTRIDFGNFCVIPKGRLEALASNAAIWNNLAGTLTRSSIPLVRVVADRGRRYVGKSKMNLVSLVMHGLSAMAVYSDIIMVRLMLAASALSAVTFLGILGIVGVKFFTQLAIPGWASSTAGLLIVILLQGLMLFTISAFTVLNTRSMKVIVPRVDAVSFILRRRKLLPAALTELAE